MPPEARQDWREILLSAAALRSGLLAAVSGGGDAQAIADRAGLDRRACTIVLRALVDIGLVAPDARGIRLTARGAELVEPTKAGDPGAEVLLGERSIRNFLQLEDRLRGAPPMDDVSTGDAESRRRFMGAMREVAAPRAPEVAREFAPPHEGARLLDVGGAPGTYGSAFSAAGWAVTVFDLPETLDVVRDDLEARGLSSVGGDMTRELPAGPWDAVYLGNVLHLFDAETAAAVVARAAAAVAPGGLVAIQEMMLGRAPQAATFAVMMLVSTPGGDTYGEQTYRAWADAAGLLPERLINFDDREHQLLIARRPQ